MTGHKISPYHFYSLLVHLYFAICQEFVEHLASMCSSWFQEELYQCKFWLVLGFDFFCWVTVRFVFCFSSVLSCSISPITCLSVLLNIQFCFLCSDFGSSLCSPSCFETRCVWTWRKRRRGLCANERSATEKSAETSGATTAAPVVLGALCQVEWCVIAMEGDHLLEAAWPPKWAQAQEEAPEFKERAVSRPSVAEKYTACIVEIVLCSSSSTVLWKKRNFHV